MTIKIDLLLPPVGMGESEELVKYLYIQFRRIVDALLIPDFVIDGDLTVPDGWIVVGDGAIAGSNHWTGTAVLGEGFLELYGPASSGTPFIDFHYNAGQTDFDARIVCDGADQLSVEGATLRGTINPAFKADGGWYYVTGDNGIYWSTHGGGWKMIDSTWLRVEGDKGIYTGGLIGAYGARIGAHPVYGSTYAWFGNEAMGGAGQYAVMQDNTGTTYINCATGKDITFRINNSQYCAITPTGSFFINVIATSSGTAVHRLASGQITLISSSQRYKKDFTLLDVEDIASNPLWQFKPGRFRWKEDLVQNGAEENARCPNGFPGLLAEDLAAIDPALVSLDADGLPQSIHDSAVIGLLVTACHQLRRRIKKLEDRIPV